MKYETLKEIDEYITDSNHGFSYMCASNGCNCNYRRN